MSMRRKQCGTVAGYQAHKRAGEDACALCLEARREYSAARRRGETGSRADSRAAKRRLELVRGDGGAANDLLGEGPRYLGRRGRELWESVTSDFELNSASLVVLGETCRMVDRVERFAAALANRQTFWFEVDGLDKADEAGVPVVVNGMIGEARQMTAAIRQNLAGLGVLKAKPGGKGSSPLQELVAARAARLAEGEK